MEKESIPVIILCGGKGIRLIEETVSKPKPMVEIGGKPILWHILKIYAHQGYNNFILCLGYKGKQIKEYFLNHRLFISDFSIETKGGNVSVHNESDIDDFKITFVDTGFETPTSGRLLQARKYIKGFRFMVTYGDGVSNVDLNKLYEFHLKQESENGVAGTITGVHPVSKHGLVQCDQRGIITLFREKPILSDYTNGGFMVYNQEIFKYLKPNQMLEYSLIDASLERKLALYYHDGFWHSMDNYQDMINLNKLWESNPEWKIWE